MRIYGLSVEWKQPPKTGDVDNFFAAKTAIANTVLVDLCKEEVNEIADIYEGNRYVEKVTIYKQKNSSSSIT